MGKNTIWYGLEPVAAVHKMNEGDLLFSGNKAFRKKKAILKKSRKPSSNLARSYFKFKSAEQINVVF